MNDINSMQDSIETAIKERRTIEMDYVSESKNSQARRSTRKLDPYMLDGMYLIGICHYRRESRTFRIDRIVDLRLTNNAFNFSASIFDEIKKKNETFKQKYRISSSTPLVTKDEKIPKDSSELITEFISALESEIEAIKKRGASDVIIRHGTFQGKSAGQFKYHFRLGVLATIPEDSMVEIVIGKDRLKGYVLGCDGLDIFIAVDEFIGEDVVEAKLHSAPYYLLELLKKALSDVKSGGLKVNTETAEKLFNKRQSVTGLAEIPGLTTLGYYPNERQKKAISSALGNDITFIWGPPGTGKTVTLARIVESFVKKGLRTLVVSHTNIAIDKALLDIIDCVKVMPEYSDGKFIRYGMPQDPKLSAIEEVNIEKIREKKTKPLLEEHDALTKERNTKQKHLDETNELLRDFNTKMLIERKRDLLSDNLRELRKKKQELENNIVITRDKLAKIEGDIGKYQTYGAVRKFFTNFTGQDITTLTRNKSIAKTQLENYQKASSEIPMQIHELESSLDTVEPELKKITDKIVADGKKCDDLKAKKDSLEQILQKLDERIEAINRLFSDMELKIVNEALVVGATLTKTYVSKELLRQKYDVLIVDEASMAPLPALFMNATFSNNKVVVIGDFMQLAPICSSRDYIVQKWLKRDIFDEAGIIEHVKKQKDDPRLVKLNMQYRMHPEIMDIANTYIYRPLGNKLYTDEKTKSIGKGFLHNEPAAGKHVAIYDMSTVQPWCSRLASYSRFNIYSASLAVHLARLAINNGIAPDEIAIIAPYRAQINLIAKFIEEEAKEFEAIDKVRVNTVFKFQGNERQLVIFDTVDSYPLPPGRLLDDKSAGGEDERHINVAFTRAREKLLIISNADYIRKQHSSSSLLRRILMHVQDKEHLLDSSKELTFYESVNFEKALQALKVVNYKIKPSDTSVYDQSNFFEAYFADLLKSKKKVVIFSPFISEKRVSKLGDLFNAIRKRGVDVLVFTRPAIKQGNVLQGNAESVIQSLRDIGVVVNTKKFNMHEKISIIDDRVVWSGSLNILSHSNTTEVMYRFEGKKIAEQIIKNFAISKSIQHSKCETIIEEYCDLCGAPMKLKDSKNGAFLSCSKFPQCRGYKRLTPDHVYSLVKDKVICEKCESEMSLRRGRRGYFFGCNRYPDCRGTKDIFSVLYSIQEKASPEDKKGISELELELAVSEVDNIEKDAEQKAGEEQIEEDGGNTDGSMRKDSICLSCLKYESETDDYEGECLLDEDIDDTHKCSSYEEKEYRKYKEYEEEEEP